jgi:DNA-binding NarL/FixJ family response regulator
MNEAEIRVLLVEDEAIVGKAIRALLERERWITVVGEAVSGEEAVRKAQELQPDVIVLDLQLPDRPGVAVIREVLEQDQAARILVLTSKAGKHEVVSAFRAGAAGYVLKTQAVPDLVQAIANVCRGQSPLYPTIAGLMLNELSHGAEHEQPDRPLSAAEIRVLTLVAQGLSNQEIARILSLSHTTVRLHMSSILSKLHLENRTQAALYALQYGFTTLQTSTEPKPPAPAV